MSIIRKRFVAQVLKEEGDRFLKNQGREIRKQLHFHTKRIVNERVTKVTSGDAMDGQLSISFVSYLRLLDLRKNTRSRSTNRITRKGYQIYNRFAMGHYYGIAFRLQNDFTDEMAASIKKEWEKGGLNHGQ